MGVEFEKLSGQVAADGVLDADEILALRRMGWGDGRVSLAEAESIFRINHMVTKPEDGWAEFFIEAIGELVVNGTKPRGYVSQDNADWLVAQVEADGRVCSLTELELVVRIIERADNAPFSLKQWVLGVVEQEVATGVGPTRCGGELSDSHVTAAEAQILRRTIFAVGGDRPGAVSRAEAEMLFRLKDRCVNAENAPEWKTLFVQGVANYLMAFASENAQISRERAAELQAFVADNKPNVGRFLGRMAEAAPNSFGVVFGRKSQEPTREDRVAADGEITSSERAWLDAKIDADGEIDTYEQALLDFIAEDAG